MEITCPVCHETLGDAQCPPHFVPCTISPCAHLICLSCHVQTERDDCVICRAPIERVLPMVQLVNDKPEAVQMARAYVLSEEPRPPISRQTTLTAARGLQQLREASPPPPPTTLTAYEDEGARILSSGRTRNGRYVIG